MTDFTKQIFGAAAIAAMAFQVDTALAADSEGRFAQEGPGQLECASVFTDDPDDQETRLLAAWLTGYFTAHNQLLNDTYDITPWQTPATVLGLLKQFCDQNPTQQVTIGAQQIVRFLAANRLTEESQPVMIGTGDQQTLLYSEVVRQVRERLTAGGYLFGSSEEDLDKAIRDFQTDNNLPATGVLNQQTLAFILE